MPPEPSEEWHRQETYRSLIQISVEGFKLLVLLNGGAAVALLAYLGNVTAKGAAVRDFHAPMVLFVTGLAFCGLALISSYLTQLALFSESHGRRFTPGHGFWLWLSVIFVVLSLGAFGGGRSARSADSSRDDMARG